MDKNHKQFNIENKPLGLEDFIKIQDGRLVLKAPLQTDNFLAGKRGVQIRQEGLNSSGGVIQGATISGGTQSTVITGDLTHTGSAVGFYNVTPTGQATAIGTTSNQDVGSSFNQTNINTAINALVAQLNKINTILHNVGITN